MVFRTLLPAPPLPVLALIQVYCFHSFQMNLTRNPQALAESEQRDRDNLFELVDILESLSEVGQGSRWRRKTEDAVARTAGYTRTIPESSVRRLLESAGVSPGRIWILLMRCAQQKARHSGCSTHHDWGFKFRFAGGHPLLCLVCSTFNSSSS